MKLWHIIGLLPLMFLIGIACGQSDETQVPTPVKVLVSNPPELLSRASQEMLVPKGLLASLVWQASQGRRDGRVRSAPLAPLDRRA